MITYRPFFLLFLLSALLLPVIGCEEDVVAILGTDQSFSLYGVLTPEADTQWVRVYPIENRLEPIQPEPLDVTFTSTDLMSGQTRVWRDSTIQEPSGQYAHVFWAPFQAAYGHTYQLEVTGTADEKSSVEVHVPDVAELVVQEPTTTIRARQPVIVQGAVPGLIKIEVIYEVKFTEGAPSETTRNISISYDGQQSQVENGWQIIVQLTRDYRTIVDRLSNSGLYSPSFGVRLHGITMRMVAVNEDWHPPGGVFDPEVLVQPGTMSNVQNGFGFVGAGYRLETTWRPEEEVLDEAGFRPFE